MEKKAEANLPTKYGRFRAIVYECAGEHHMALIMGKVSGEPILVRVHSECLTGDVFHSLKCDCGEQLEKAMQLISKEGSGIILYLRQEGRGIGLLNKIKAYKLQERGMDTVEANEKLGFKADLRDYTVGVKMLADLGAKKIRLLTNNPKKIEGLKKYGIEIVERMPLATKPTKENRGYLETKRKKLGHFIEGKGVVG